MTNIAFQDIAGGTVTVYTANPDLPRVDRIKTALNELRHVACIKVYLYKGRKLRHLFTRKF